MTDQDVIELAAILVNEHGHAALEIAKRRKAQHAHEPLGDGFLLWGRIVDATARLLRIHPTHSAYVN
ncbi:MAG: hypothetical protein JO001_20325 [Alphaproteobacteria bacterium]|nr:hypothetical protein [Alphaproteobacteria bacterium]